MNAEERAALDAWFAEADDVLTDWEPDPYREPDVMVAQAPVDDAGDVLPPLADSYYEQRTRSAQCGPDCEGCRLIAALLRPREPDGSGVVTYEITGPLFRPEWFGPVFSENMALRAGRFIPAGAAVGFRGAVPRAVVLDEAYPWNAADADPWQDIADALNAGWEQIGATNDPCAVPELDNCEPTPTARALEARRNRNTGPAERRWLDGRRRRRGMP